jgi:hypothetical protein
VSVSSTGAEGGATSGSAKQAFSADGRLVAFDSQASNLVEGDDNASTDAFLHDLSTGETKIIGLSSGGEQGIYGSAGSAVAANGKVVAFGGVSPNLVPGDTNNKTDIFIRNLQSGITTRVSVGSSSQHHFGNRYGIVGPVVFPDSKKIDTGFIHQFYFFDELAQALTRGEGFAVFIVVVVAKHAYA